ncbi:TPM domain-containing protein [Dongia sp.]|uniref:TPM domain-containing protein n=1 Tax=Dongia sp. TaxID=1977262 RepID=UPI0037514961
MTVIPFSVLRLAALAVAAATLVTVALAFTTPERTGFVTDAAGILGPDTEIGLAARLSDLQRRTGTEVVVVTLDSLQGASIETWGNLLGESWGIGRAGGNDRGALLIVAPNDRKVRIAVGYGLGNRLSDSIAEMIVADHILPYFRQGNFVRGIESGVASIELQLDPAGSASTTASGTDVERTAYPIAARPPSLWQRLRAKLTPGGDAKAIAVWVLVFVVMFIWMVINVGNVGDGGGGRRGWGGYNCYGGGGISIGGGSSGGGGGSSPRGSFGGGATGSW